MPPTLLSTPTFQIPNKSINKTENSKTNAIDELKNFFAKGKKLKPTTAAKKETKEEECQLNNLSFFRSAINQRRAHIDNSSDSSDDEFQ